MQAKPKPSVNLDWLQVPQRVPISKNPLQDAKGIRQTQTVGSELADLLG